MRMGEVIGHVSLSKMHASLAGARWIVVRPVGGEAAEEVVVFDEFGAGEGIRVGFSEGAEAAMPFLPERKPVDAYAACQIES